MTPSEPAGPAQELTLTDVPTAGRFEARRDGELAGYLDYLQKRGRLALVHTQVEGAHRGSGVGAQLVLFAFDEARHRGLRVIPLCPYVRSYLERHPELADIVVGSPKASSGS